MKWEGVERGNAEGRGTEKCEAIMVGAGESQKFTSRGAWFFKALEEKEELRP